MTAEIENEEVDEKPRTLFVGNVPPVTKKRELEILFGDIGPLKRCHMQYPRKGTGKQDEPLVAYITYALCEDAVAAVEQFSRQKIGKNKLNIKLVKSRSDQHREPREPRASRPIGVPNYSANLEPLPDKKPRAKPINKKPRLIVRNLSFNANEESIRNHFSGCGEIKEVSVLRKPNGKLVGCAFIQYANVFEAAKAIKTLNLQPFLERPIAIDWAVPKEKFQSGGDVQVKTDYDDESEIKQEIKEEDDSDEGSSSKKKADDDDSDIDEDEDDEEEEEETKFKPAWKQNTNDADEGKTLFIRNLSFDTTEEELKTFFEPFGPLRYALICKDQLTEHPKGTAFVKFQELEGAQKCLAKYEEDSSEFYLTSRNFYVSVALSKGKLESKMNDGKEQPKKDNRHLYLAREGFIRPGSDAAVGVSIQDMNRRSALHQKKKQLLKDLGVFVSETRLCIHNLPVSLKDDNLRKIFLRHAGPGAVVTEAKIMRDFKLLNRDSKEYGFVSFTKHEHALTALRTINNNPNIFTPNKRPIVEFSLENRKAVTARERRLEKSKEKNPLVQSKTSGEQTEAAEGNEEEGTVKLSKKLKRKLKKQMKKEGVVETATEAMEEKQEDDEPSKKKKKRHRDIENNIEEFSGLTAKEGITALPSFKPKGKITRKSLKPAKNKGKPDRRMREPKTRRKETGRDRTDSVDKLVSKHQKEIKEASRAVVAKKGKKWFQ